MMIMEDSKMYKIEHDLKAIMYSTYDTPNKQMPMLAYQKCIIIPPPPRKK